MSCPTTSTRQSKNWLLGPLAPRSERSGILVFALHCPHRGELGTKRVLRQYASLRRRNLPVVVLHAVRNALLASQNDRRGSGRLEPSSGLRDRFCGRKCVIG